MASFPRTLMIDTYKNVLVLIPHPDDEAIGCGGLLAKLAQQGANIKAILVSDGSGDGGLPEGISKIREQEFIASLDILGVRDYECWGLLDGHLATNKQLSVLLKTAIKAYSPDLIIAPWHEDMHPDHSTVGNSIKEQASCLLADILYYEVWTPLVCTHFLDISDVVTLKQNAILAHKTALNYGHYLEGIMGLARYRALYLPFEKTLKYAEAYHLHIKKTKGWFDFLWTKH